MWLLQWREENRVDEFHAIHTTTVFIKTEVQLTYNIRLVSDVQQRDYIFADYTKLQVTTR